MLDPLRKNKKLILDSGPIGEITEVIILGRLMQKGYQVLKPWASSSRYDLAVDTGNGTIKRGQCKTGRYRHSSMSFPVATKGRVSAKLRPYTKEQIDVFWVYLPDNDTVYVIPIEIINTKTEFSLKLTTPVRDTRQDKSLHMAKDFEL